MDTPNDEEKKPSLFGSSMGASDLFAKMDLPNNDPAKQLDSNGNEIIIGCVIRVKVNLKAFHLSAKGRGSFDLETKEFMQDKSTKYLSIPPGLRGIATRVYDKNDSEANKPILVKFTPGENVEEGFDSPVTFSMHFESKEVERVL